MNGLHAVGILGGTFDPIHIGHLTLAREARRQLGLERVILLPAGKPWQRAPCASPEDRLAMARLALPPSDPITVDDREVRRDTPTYTLDTLLELRAEWGNERPVWLILGADAFLNLPTWHRWQEMLKYAHIAVFCRPGSHLAATAMDPALRRLFDHHACPLTSAGGPAGSIVALEMPLLDISSTRVRKLLRQGTGQRELQDLIPAAVLDYIEFHKPYQ